MTIAQKRLMRLLEQHGGEAEYWPLVNDWVKDDGPHKSLALRNINRTMDALIKAGRIEIDNDGFVKTKEAQS